MDIKEGQCPTCQVVRVMVAPNCRECGEALRPLVRVVDEEGKPRYEFVLEEGSGPTSFGFSPPLEAHSSLTPSNGSVT